MEDIFNKQVHHLKSTQKTFYEAILTLLRVVYDGGTVRALTENIAFTTESLQNYLSNAENDGIIETLTGRVSRSQRMDVDDFLTAVNATFAAKCNQDCEKICFNRNRPNRITAVLVSASKPCTPNSAQAPPRAANGNGAIQRAPVTYPHSSLMTAQLPALDTSSFQQQKNKQPRHVAQNDDAATSADRSQGGAEARGAQRQAQQQQQQQQPTRDRCPPNISPHFLNGKNNVWANMSKWVATETAVATAQANHPLPQNKRKHRTASDSDEDWSEETEMATSSTTKARRTADPTPPSRQAQPRAEDPPDEHHHKRQQQERHRFSSAHHSTSGAAQTPESSTGSLRSSHTTPCSTESPNVRVLPAQDTASTPSPPHHASATTLQTQPQTPASTRKYVSLSSDQQKKVMQVMMAAQNFRCNMCKSVLQCEEYVDASNYVTIGKTYQLDHIERKELGRGDVNRLENLQVVCELCHKQKTRMEHRYIQEYLNSSLVNSIDNCIFCKKSMPHAIVIRHMVSNCIHAQKVMAPSRLGVQFGANIAQEDSIDGDCMNVNEEEWVDDVEEHDVEEEEEDDDDKDGENGEEDGKEDDEEEEDGDEEEEDQERPPRKSRRMEEEHQQHQRRHPPRQQKAAAKRSHKKKVQIAGPTASKTTTRTGSTNADVRAHLETRDIFTRWLHGSLSRNKVRGQTINARTTPSDFLADFKDFCTRTGVSFMGLISTHQFYRMIDRALDVNTLRRTHVSLNLPNVQRLRSLVHSKYFKQFPYESVFP